MKGKKNKMKKDFGVKTWLYPMPVLLISGIVALLGFSACAYGEKDVEGAWAYAEEPDVARVVVTNKTVWRLEDGRWTPSVQLSSLQRGVKVRPMVALRGNGRGYLVGKLDRWQLDGLVKRGVKIGPDDVYLSDFDKDHPVCADGHLLVRAKMPDFGKKLDVGAYVGYWKPVKKGRCLFWDEAEHGEKVERGGLLKIREDLKAIMWQREHKRSQSNPEPYRIVKLVAMEGWLRGDYREKYARYADPLNCMVETYWITPEGRLQVSRGHDAMVEFVKTDEMFADPLDARAEMAKKGAYHGVWGVNSEFNIFVVHLDRSGKGILVAFMLMMPFEWSVSGKGLIECRLDPETYALAGGGESDFPMVVHLAYDGEKNEMTLLDGGKTSGGKSRRLPFLSSDVHVEEYLKKIEEGKNLEQRRHDEHMKDKVMEVVTNRCESLSFLMKQLYGERDYISRQVSVLNVGSELRDSFSINCEGGPFVRCYLGTAISERGDKPKLPPGAIRYRQMAKPKNLPPPRAVRRMGISEVKERWRAAGLLGCSEISMVARHGDWVCCRDSTLLEWKLDDGKEDSAAKVLENRFRDGFPCDIVICTIRKSSRPK